MAIGEQLNVRPRFRTKTVPCEGEVGDLLVITPLKEDQHDASPQGLASLWFCIKAQDVAEQRPAVWARVQFDGIATCKITAVADPPQNRPELRQG